MELSKRFCFRWLPVLAASAVVLSMATIGSAQLPLIIDGRDVANLAGEGNHPTWHNPPVAFAFTFGSVAADNPTVGPGDPPTAGDKAFNYTGTDFGGLGFGIQPDVAFDAATSYFVLDLTVNPGNTLPSLTLNMKDRDFVPPIFTNIEEHQWSVPLGAAGTKRVKIPLSDPPSFTGNPSPAGSVGPGPDFDPALGLNELQLQYPYGLSCQPGGSCTGAVMDLTIHRIAIVAIPEPATFGLALVGTLMIGGFRLRRRHAD
jgi:hypothetical protein